MIYYLISLVFINLFLYYGGLLYLVLVFFSLFMLGKMVDIRLFVICCLSICLFYTFNLNFYHKKVASYEINKEVDSAEIDS